MTLADVIRARLEDPDDVIGGRLIVDAGPIVLDEVLSAVAAAGPGTFAAAMPVVARLLDDAGVVRLAALAEADDDLAVFSIEALGASRRPDAAPSLQHLIATARPTARRTAIVALARLGDASVAPWLGRRLAVAPLDEMLAARDLDPVRELIATATALAMLGEHELGPSVLALATAPRDRHEDLRVDAAAALGVVAAPQLVPAAAAALGASVARTEALVDALAGVGTAAAARALVERAAGPGSGGELARAWLRVVLGDDPARWLPALDAAPPSTRLRAGRPGRLRDELALLAERRFHAVVARDVERFTGVDVSLDTVAEAERRCAAWLDGPPGELRRWGHAYPIAQVD